MPWLPHKKIKTVLEDKQRWAALVKQLQARAKSLGDLEAKQQLATCIRLVKAWHQGHYREVPWRSIAALVAALLYFANPFDLIPDFLLGGLMDDISLLAAVYRSVSHDIEKFLVWEAQNSGGVPLDDLEEKS